MIERRKYLAILWMFFLCQAVYAQPGIGPFTVYVSEQGGAPVIVTDRTAGAYADEGRVVDVKITDVVGPIDISPLTYHLDGPPCPIYMPTGRIPAVPPPNSTANFHGIVSIKQIPSPGSSVNASFKIKDYGYWTVCGTGEKKYYPDVYTVSYLIESIKLSLDNTTVEGCKGGHIKIKVTEIFPAGKGKVSWQSSNNNIKVSGDETGADIECIDNDNAIVTATLAVDDAIFNVKVDVKVGSIKFTSSQVDKLWYPGGTFDAKTMLDANSLAKDLAWSMEKSGNYTEPTTIDANTGIITFNKRGAGVYTITATCAKAPACKENFVLREVIFGVNMFPPFTVCDGDVASFKINTTPDVGAGIFAGKTFKLRSVPTVQSGGNPAGTTDLPFTNVSSPSMIFTTTRALWYEQKKDECNMVSEYNIYASLNENGQDVDADPAILTVSALIDSVNGCVWGFAYLRIWAEGLPLFDLKKKDGGYVVTISHQGTFYRKIGTEVKIKTNKNSQFYQMVADEEEYHVKQFKGLNSTIIDDLYLPENVMKALTGKEFFDVKAINASAKAKLAFNKAVDDENERSTKLFKERKCAIEKQAKEAIKASYILRLKCAYPDCVK